MITLITITSNINCRSSTRLNAESKILSLISDSTDKIVIKLLQCIKSMVESLPFETQKKEIKEFELCTRFLQPCFQKLFDCDNDQIMFKWLNVCCFTDTDIDAHQNRPDGCTENDRKAIGYFEVKPIKYAKNHNKINIDMHRLCTFSKTGTAKYKAKHMFQVMGAGTNVQFHICEAIGDVLMVSELYCIRLPLSLDELPQRIPYLGRLYSVVELSGLIKKAFKLEISSQLKRVNDTDKIAEGQQIKNLRINTATLERIEEILVDGEEDSNTLVVGVDRLGDVGFMTAVKKVDSVFVSFQERITDLYK